MTPTLIMKPKGEKNTASTVFTLFCSNYGNLPLLGMAHHQNSPPFCSIDAPYLLPSCHLLSLLQSRAQVLRKSYNLAIRAHLDLRVCQG